MITWAYIAGFFDGEGSVFQARPRISALVSIVQAEQHVLQEIQQFLVQHCIPSVVRAKSMCSTYRKPQWVLSISKNADTIKFLSHILPYLQVKRVLAQDVIRFSVLYPNLRGRIGGNQYAHW